MSDARVMPQPGAGPTASTTSQESSAAKTIALILQMFRDHGDSMYGGEQVTQREHALQCAYLAQRSGAQPALIVAALLHDIGHLLHALPVDAPESGIDDHHEELAAKWLGENFPADVVQPVRLHVAAKRFLCATDSMYFQQLSPPSQLSLRLQGGPMSTIEVRQFLENPHYRDAVSLRRWDDEAKIVGLQTPSVEQFAEVMIQVLSA